MSGGRDFGVVPEEFFSIASNTSPINFKLALAKTELGIRTMAQLEDDFIRQPTEAEGYLVAAEAMLAGALPLTEVSPLPTIALTLLCGHGTEAALKALLAQKGLTAPELSRHPYSHNLITLWDEAIAKGAKVTIPRPLWVDHLHRVHSSPYNLRYPLGFNAIVLPNQQIMVKGLEFLILTVREEVKQ